MYMTYSDLKRQNELLREDSAIHILNMKNKDERIKNLEKQIELWKKLYEKEKKKHNDVIDTCIEMDRFILEQDKELCDLKKENDMYKSKMNKICNNEDRSKKSLAITIWRENKSQDYTFINLEDF